MSWRTEQIRRVVRFRSAVRAIAFWFAVAVGAIGLAGLHAALNPESPATVLWRQS